VRRIVSSRNIDILNKNNVILLPLQTKQVAVGEMERCQARVAPGRNVPTREVHRDFDTPPRVS